MSDRVIVLLLAAPSLAAILGQLVLVAGATQGGGKVDGGTFPPADGVRGSTGTMHRGLCR